MEANTRSAQDADGEGLGDGELVGLGAVVDGPLEGDGRPVDEGAPPHPAVTSPTTATNAA